jgi:hypothetical protein
MTYPAHRGIRPCRVSLSTLSRKVVKIRPASDPLELPCHRASQVHASTTSFVLCCGLTAAVAVGLAPPRNSEAEHTRASIERLLSAPVPASADSCNQISPEAWLRVIKSIGRALPRLIAALEPAIPDAPSGDVPWVSWEHDGGFFGFGRSETLTVWADGRSEIRVTNTGLCNLYLVVAGWEETRKLVFVKRNALSGREARRRFFAVQEAGVDLLVSRSSQSTDGEGMTTDCDGILISTPGKTVYWYCGGGDTSPENRRRFEAVKKIMDDFDKSPTCALPFRPIGWRALWWDGRGEYPFRW